MYGWAVRGHGTPENTHPGMIQSRYLNVGAGRRDNRTCNSLEMWYYLFTSDELTDTRAEALTDASRSTVKARPVPFLEF